MSGGHWETHKQMSDHIGAKLTYPLLPGHATSMLGDSCREIFFPKLNVFPIMRRYVPKHNTVPRDSSELQKHFLSVKIMECLPHCRNIETLSYKGKRFSIP